MNADFIKSAVAGLVGTLLIALNHKLQLELTPAEVVAISGIVVAFIGKEVLNNRAPDSPAPVKLQPPTVTTLDPKAVADAITKTLADATKAVAPLLVALLASIALLAPAQASAQALTVGPSLPAIAITPGAGHPATLAAGAGITVGADFFPTTLLDQKAHWLTVGLDAFGSAVPVDGKVTANASVAIHACMLGLFCAGFGVKLLANDGTGALDGKLTHASLMVLIEPDCRVMKLLWPLFAAAPPAPAPVDKPIDGDHPNGV